MTFDTLTADYAALLAAADDDQTPIADRLAALSRALNKERGLFAPAIKEGRLEDLRDAMRPRFGIQERIQKAVNG